MLRRPEGPAWLAPALAAAAFAALLLPLLLHGLVPTSLPGHGMEEMRARVRASRWLALLLAAAALSALSLRLRERPAPAAREAKALLAAGAALAVAFALPLHDAWSAERARDAYGRTGVLHEASHVSLEGVHNVAEGLVYEVPTLPGAPALLEDVPVVRGDAWHVYAVVEGPRWDGFEPPRVEADGVACSPSVYLDEHGGPEPRFGAVWRCVAERSGTTTLRMVSGAPEPRGESLQLVSLSVLQAGFWSALDGGVVLVGASLAAGAGLLLLEGRWRARRATAA